VRRIVDKIINGTVAHTARTKNKDFHKSVVGL